MVDHTVGRALDLFDVEAGTVRRWSGGGKRARKPSGADDA
jgi:4-hydroxy-3-polyprenylbenzoate decarboxylase